MVCLFFSSFSSLRTPFFATEISLYTSRRSFAKRTRPGTVVSAITAHSSSLMKVYKASELSTEELCKVTARPRVNFSSILDIVAPIVDDVRLRGDAAVADYTVRFDGVDLGPLPCRPISDFPNPTLPEDVTAAFDTAYENIAAFHSAQKDTKPVDIETMPGVRCRRVSRPISSVGIYVPGGTAVLPSSALMLAIPASLAGCKTIVLATPPRKDGSISPEVIYCAKKAGVTHILAAGGAQAVAAMAWGTASCPKVDKVAGPGNQFVTAAKMMLQNSEAMIAIDMPAGPSEVLVVADASAPPVHVALDLLSQAEHGPDSQAVLVALPGVDIPGIVSEIQSQCDRLPRAETTKKALAHSAIVAVSSKDEAAAFCNAYAAEHLIINTEDAESWLPLIEHAGSVFLGRWTPESVGDYASGTNHTLPTYGYAKMYSGVSLDTFQKKMTVQELTKEGLETLGPTVVKMAEVEGLDAHRRAVSVRLGLEQ